MKGRSWYWVLPAAAGFALITAAVLLSSSTPSSPSIPVANAQEPTATLTPVPPTATATVNPNCDLEVDKTDSPDPVAAGGEITYTITITNEGSGGGDCADLDVVDGIPADTDCVDAAVASSSDIDEADFDIDGCDSSGDVTWSTSTNLDTDDSVVLTMVVETDSGLDEGDRIENEACATSTSDVGGDCDQQRTTIGEEATATPQPTATVRPVTPAPTVIVPPPPAPTARPLATIAPPVTGTGSDSGPNTLAIGLGALGACLLLASGVALVKRTR